MRLVYVLSRWNQGTETFVRREVAAALAAGHRVEVVSLKPPGPPDGIVDEAAITVHAPGLGTAAAGAARAVLARPRAAARSLARIVRLGRPGTWAPHVRAWLTGLAASRAVDDPDVVVAHFAWVSSTAADALATVFDRPFAVFAHAHDIYEHRCIDRYLSDRLRRSIVTFVESEQIAEHVRSSFAVEPVVMRMGVPESFVVPEPPRRTGGAPRVLSVGALRAKKGHDLLISAVADHDGVRLAIAGDGEEREGLERLARERGVADRVDLLGHVPPEAVRDLLDGSSVFCLASRVTPSGDRDGVPNVLIEAMARGVPVVATAVAGIPDLLDDGCGVVVPPDDRTALSEALGRVLADPEEAHAMARRARDRIEDGYTTGRNWERLASVLRERLAGVGADR